MAFKYSYTKENHDEILVDDPIYGKFIVPYPYSKIIFTKEMKRLEDIAQTGFAQYDYPGLAENERLSHSVGAFYNMNEIIKHLEKELKNYGITISQDDKDVALCSMLLHDIGHGPNSHSFEETTKYSHEKRTVDILLGDTEIHELLVELFGEEKTKRIASFISEIDDKETYENKNSFTNLLKHLVSNQLDADRLDYLQRDSYYAEIPTAIRTKNIVESLGVVVNANQDYQLVVNKKGLSNIETMLIERFQKYRDLYFTKSSEVMDIVFSKIVDRYKECKDSVKGELPKQFRKLAEDPENIDLQDFLSMTDTPIMEAIQVIKETSDDELLRYLSDKDNLKDYQTFDTALNSEYTKNKLFKIFGTEKVFDTISVFPLHHKTKLYKINEGLKINYGNKIVELSEATNFIKPQETLKSNSLVFNPEILRIELGMSKEEFKNYEPQINKLIEKLNKKPEEFELKYIIPENLRESLSKENITQEFLKNDFDIIEESSKENDDKYYDDRDLSLLKRGGSLRIRKATQDNDIKIKGTYKNPIEKGEVYSSREEIEEKLSEASLENLKEVMRSKKINVDLDSIMPRPILNSKTNRQDVVFEKNNVRVCVSFDDTQYVNYVLGDTKAQDSMIEIEAIGDVTDRVVLNEIHDFLSEKFEGLDTNKQSKYERGSQKTRDIYKAAQKQKGSKEGENR